MNNLQTGKRLHGIDALRAIAMLLGIFLHATIAYKQFPLPTWPHDNTYHHLAYDYVYMLIHTFRMPLFFLIAGFFCRFLIIKIGEKEFIKHRWKRIAIPFFICLFTILPFTIFPFLVYKNSGSFGNNWDANFSKSLRQLLGWNGMAHLWFLYYLLIYYTVVILICRIVKTMRIQKFFFFLIRKWEQKKKATFWLFLIAVLATWGILLFADDFFISVDTGIIPDIIFLAFYGLFFSLGWLINIRPDIFEQLAKYAWFFLIPGMMLSIVTWYSEFILIPGENTFATVKQLKGVISVQVLLLVFGFTGVFLRYFKKESFFWRYISDAAYWMYLLQLGIVAGLQVAFIYLSIPGLIKFWLVLVAAFLVTLFTYQVFVRYTKIGLYLHGYRKKTLKRRINLFE